MKAKYRHYGNDCIIYDQVACVDNIFITVRSYNSCWFNAEPEITTKLCPTNAEARRMFYGICDRLEKKKYKCEYKEV